MRRTHPAEILLSYFWKGIDGLWIRTSSAFYGFMWPDGYKDAKKIQTENREKSHELIQREEKIQLDSKALALREQVIELKSQELEEQQKKLQDTIRTKVEEQRILQIESWRLENKQLSQNISEQKEQLDKIEKLLEEDRSKIENIFQFACSAELQRIYGSLILLQSSFNQLDKGVSESISEVKKQTDQHSAQSNDIIKMVLNENRRHEELLIEQNDKHVNTLVDQQDKYRGSLEEQVHFQRKQLSRRNHKPSRVIHNTLTINNPNILLRDSKRNMSRSSSSGLQITDISDNTPTPLPMLRSPSPT